MSKRLRRYLEARERGGWGWQAKLAEQELPAGESWPWLAGHYVGMLDEVLDLLSEKRVRDLLDLDEDESAPREG